MNEVSRTTPSWLAGNWVPLLALIVSIVAAAFTGLSYKFQSRAGKVVVGVNKIFVRSIGGAHVLLPVSFANVGGQSVEIRDALLTEEFDGTTTAYGCWFTVKPDHVDSFLNGSWYGKTDALPALASYFSPFAVAAGSQEVQYLAFNLYSGAALFEAGRRVKYRLVVQTQAGDQEFIGTVEWPLNGMRETLNGGGAQGQLFDSATKWRNKVAGATPNPS